MNEVTSPATSVRANASFAPCSTPQYPDPCELGMLSHPDSPNPAHSSAWSASTERPGRPLTTPMAMLMFEACAADSVPAGSWESEPAGAAGAAGAGNGLALRLSGPPMLASEPADVGTLFASGVLLSTPGALFLFRVAGVFAGLLSSTYLA